MSRAPSFCGVILAAGPSARMGTETALLPWRTASDPAANSGTLLSATIDLLKPHSDMVIVVTGANTAALSATIYSQAAFLVENNTPELGPFSSLKLGLQAVLRYGRDAVIVTSVDHPPVQHTTLMHLHDAFLAGVEQDMWAAVPEFDGATGFPVALGREMIEQLLRAQLTATAFDVLQSHANRIIYVPVDDPFVTTTINTPEDYARICAAVSAPGAKT